MNYPGLDLRSWRNFEESLSLVSMNKRHITYTYIHRYTLYISCALCVYKYISYMFIGTSPTKSVSLNVQGFLLSCHLTSATLLDRAPIKR